MSYPQVMLVLFGITPCFLTLLYKNINQINIIIILPIF